MKHKPSPPEVTFRGHMKTTILFLALIAFMSFSFTTKEAVKEEALPTCNCGSWQGPWFGTSEWPKTKSCSRGANYGIVVWEWKSANSTEPVCNCDGGGTFLPW